MTESAARPPAEIPHEVQLYIAQRNLGKDATARAFKSEEEAYRAADARIAKTQEAAAETIAPAISTALVKPATSVDGILWI